MILLKQCIAIAEYDFFIEHKSGIKYIVPDTLSRAPTPEPYQPLATNTYIASVSGLLCLIPILVSEDVEGSSVATVYTYIHTYIHT